mmetsp:Transcript_5230/g.13124  ORF Transcript_5230/g.13124 Transcript_5230/m.13124 type:complete len:760 (-) Transcript_5230:30-2309(-)
MGVTDDGTLAGARAHPGPGREVLRTTADGRRYFERQEELRSLEPDEPPDEPTDVAPGSGGFDSIISPLTPAERAHFAALSEAEQEMARVMVRLRHRNCHKAPNGAYDTFDRLAGVDEIATDRRGSARKRAQKAAAPFVESFLVESFFGRRLREAAPAAPDAAAPAPAPLVAAPAPDAAAAPADPRLQVGRMVRKKFTGSGWFDGSVTSIADGSFQVLWSDGDEIAYPFKAAREMLDAAESTAAAPVAAALLPARRKRALPTAGFGSSDEEEPSRRADNDGEAPTTAPVPPPPAPPVPSPAPAPAAEPPQAAAPATIDDDAAPTPTLREDAAIEPVQRQKESRQDLSPDSVGGSSVNRLEAELADEKYRRARVEAQMEASSQAVIMRLEQELGAVDVWEQNNRVGGSDGKIALGIGPTRNHSQPIKLTDATLDPKFRSLLDMVLLVGRLKIEPSEFEKIQTIYVINNGRAEPHTDPKNLGLSHLINIGNHADATNPSAGALWTPGGIRDTYYKMISFQAQDPHAVMPYEGTRYSLCYFRTFPDVSESLRAQMNGYGFALAPSVKLEDQPRPEPTSDDHPVILHTVDLNGLQRGRLTEEGLKLAEESIANAQKLIDGARQVEVKREPPDDAPPPKRRRQKPKISFASAGPTPEHAADPAPWPAAGHKLKIEIAAVYTRHGYGKNTRIADVKSIIDDYGFTNRGRSSNPRFMRLYPPEHFPKSQEGCIRSFKALMTYLDSALAEASKAAAPPTVTPTEPEPR